MSEEESKSDERKDTGRVEAFSDGVFAIAITLLILTIPVPPRHQDIQAYVIDQAPFFLAYLVSFMSILVMWTNHHGIFNLIVRSDRRFLIINGILLMLITFLNYPTAVIASAMRDRSSLQFAALFYTGTLVAISLVYNLTWRYATFRLRLLDDHVDPQVVRKITREYRFGPLYYVAAFALSYLNAYAGLVLALLLAVYFGLTGRADPVHSMKSKR